MMKATKTWVLIALLFIPAINVHPWPIPDTGQTKCYNYSAEIPCPAPGEPFYGQDANYKINPPSYTKLGTYGNVLPDDAAIWVMVRDNVTGLIWENKNNMDGMPDYTNPNDADNTYTWCDNNPATNNGHIGTCGNGTDTEDYIKLLNDTIFGGFTDWRMPTVRELSTLINQQSRNPAIFSDYFVSTKSSAYWTSTTRGPYAGAMVVDFQTGFINGTYKSIGYNARAIRNTVNTSHLFSINDDDTVTDANTGLMWSRQNIGNKTWEEALSYVKNLMYAGYSDWRIPNTNELRTIVDYSKINPAIDSNFFVNTISSYYWSSTNATDVMNNVRCIDFNDGDDNGNDVNKATTQTFRIVRGGQNRITGNLVITAPNQADKAGTFIEIIADNIPNNGSYNWTVTGPASVNCVLKIESLSTASKGTAQGLFSIQESIQELKITVVKVGTGTGSVADTIGDINCGNDCTANYSSITTVTLTAVPDASSTFTGWSGGGCTGAQTTCMVTTDIAKTITATFGLKTYTITATAGINGSISSSATVNHGTTSIFTITPNEGYNVADVLIDGSSVGIKTTYTFNNVTSNHTIAATFILKSDLDMNGAVDIVDAIIALKTISSLKIGVPVHREADVDGDNKIGLAEAIYALQCIARLRNNYSPVLTLIGDKTVNEGSSLNFNLIASDKNGDTLTYAADGLPMGAQVNPTTGVFTWTPTYSQSGVYPVTFNVRDDYGGTDSISITITVNNINQPPVLSAIGNKTVTEVSLLSFVISATDADGDALIYTTSLLPTGASFNTATKTFSWTPIPGQNGTYWITFTVSDGLGGVSSETITITVIQFTISAPDYLPLNIGDWMDYRQSSTGTIARTTVTGPINIGGVPTKGVNYLVSGGTEYYTSDLNGVKLYGTYVIAPGYYTGNVYFNAPLLLIANNTQLYTTRVSNSSFTLNLHVNVTSTTNILGLEDIQTANTILKDCVKVSLRIDYYIVELNQYMPGETVYYWFYKGVGCVKQVSNSETAVITQSHINGTQRTY
jgi:hypothetical protein